MKAQGQPNIRRGSASGNRWSTCPKMAAFSDGTDRHGFLDMATVGLLPLWFMRTTQINDLRHN